MKLIVRVLIVMLLSGAGWAIAEPGCKQPEVLHFATIPKKSLVQQYQEFEPLRLELQRVLGIPVQTVSVHSYQAVIEGVLSGAVDLAELGPAAYIQTKSRDPGVQALAAYSFKGGAFTPEGSYYHSLLLTGTGVNIKSIHDLEHRSVALTDPGSTSGALIPMTEFKRETGVVLADYVGKLIYAGSHDRAIEAVLSGAVDAAFVSSRRADDYIGRGEAASSDLRELWRSRPIHYDPFTVSSHLCPEVQARIRQVLLTPSSARRVLLETKGAVGMQSVSDEDYRWLEPLVRQLD
ncbi:phosphate/phosphite/phosphonate ABC transporter substrate-binding protein [Marinobacterium sediminicola]|uniref:Phosphonate transport system substrate-binding protein n=1 Tax=Marinobacterium sediminicola TaxID=518898 RepID=A0ABY1RYL4_9GAMM|nr:phosphate/phosphite/phosphonate ABC transporter substrate-binding protein [Marinobacterium sediminicola]ULG68069.1 phosphate/phosphite/phosphonate ABC transporter substrate-binding protein [Marinobacterium sediminicola]SMR73421.1 phosphonate transport system substrate-binding protein [Marinobacterium sediminicola]